MNSTTDEMPTFQFGQDTAFFSNGSVKQHVSGQWYVQDDGWKPISEEEAARLLREISTS